MLKNNIEVDVKIKCIEAGKTQAQLGEMIGSTGQYVNRIIKKGDGVKDISANKYVLPSIQREFVWSTAQIERLFDSVMQDYCFIFWRYKR